MEAIIASIPKQVMNKIAKEEFGVSGTTLKAELKKKNIQVGTKKAEDLEQIKEKVEDTAQRTGSISLTAHLYRTTESTLKKLDINRSNISDPAKMGYHYLD